MNYTILPQSLVVNFDGLTLTIARDDHRFNQVINAIKQGDFETAKNIAQNNNIFNDDFELVDDQLFYKGELLPDGLAQRVLAFAKDDLPFDYLIKFFEKLKDNPSYNSRQMLYKFLEHNGHPITPEGNFIAYRGVTHDFKDVHTKTFDNSVGSICEMNRDLVDDNPNNTCSAGLHVACYDYANSFGHTLVEVEVDPRDVVCVPTDYNGTKMRTCRFKVLNVCKNERNEQIYNQESNLKGNSLIAHPVVLPCGGYGTIIDYLENENMYEIEGYDEIEGNEEYFIDYFELDDFEVL